MPHELPKSYEPGAIEARWAEYWVKEKLFSVATPSASEAARRQIFTLLLPPPNVTGRLHMGHMLNHTQMDIIVRWRRMRGFLTLWLPGTDHAGIATQMMVERELASEGVDRRQLGRETFVKRVWEWREHYGGVILQQMKRLGDSVDWQREYFTMDEGLSRAVREAFVRLYEDSLIYRGKYIVNWCPRCMTAISDLEVVHEDFAGKLYHIRYPVSGNKEFITVATTRPETMLGDVAVAVHPQDERYRRFQGKKLRLPLMDREIPVIADDFVNPEFGTGAVKVTPAHDPNDFQMGLRHDLPQIDVMDESGHMNENAGPYAGLDRYDAREKILHDLEQQGLLATVKDHVYAIGKCDRCKTIVEPRLSTQWFVAVTKEDSEGGPSLVRRAIDAVANGAIRITPENYKTIYLNWMENIHDWCISRQLWWGHRIPAWHCGGCKEIVVAREAPTKCPHCGSAALEQDTDVLDTWFSSGLLPITTLGWPERTRDLETFYPTSLLITAYEILFFWVARMIMFGCHFMPGNLEDSVPFREVYIHSLVRDAERQKMSKTKGNVLDPIEIIEKYGTDAVRFTLAAMAAPGTDIAFNPSRTEGYRAFANKIWNAARFIFMNIDRARQAEVWSLSALQKQTDSANARSSKRRSSSIELSHFQPVTLEDRWILSRFNHVAAEVQQALAGYRFHEAADRVYHFFWDEFCDWYLELIKNRLTAFDADAQKNAAQKQSAQIALRNLVTLFEAALRLLSPFMPFITEEIWHAIYDGKPPLKSIALAAFPEGSSAQMDSSAEAEMVLLQELIVNIRNLRAELKAEPKLRLPVQIHCRSDFRSLVTDNKSALERLANVDGIAFVENSLANAPGARSTASYDVRVLYERKLDSAAERERLTKELQKLQSEFLNAQRQLGNQQFLAKAPPQVVEGIRRRAQEVSVLLEKTQGALAELS